MAKKDKFKAISDEIDKLPESKAELGRSLLEKARFMDEGLNNLQKEIAKSGWVEKYQNGATQFGLKKSSHADVYNTLIKNYNSTIKQILDLLPKDEGEEDELLGFIRKK